MGNSASSSGGGIFSGPGTLAVTGSTISGNSGSGFVSAGTATITSSTISGNSASDDGGGIYISAGITVTVNNSTISGNDASDRGGGIYNHGSTNYSMGGTMIVTGSTISGNSATDGGGIYPSIGGTATVTNSIVANSTAGGDVFGTLAGSFNLIEDGSGGLGDTIALDPLLGPLADNGGPTQTHMLLLGSQAIDAGDPSFADPSSYDQRGFAFDRVVGGRIDIGAIESGATSADFDSDGDIDGSEFLHWQRGFDSPLPLHSNGDANLDGAVDAYDLDLWSSTFGEAETSPQTGLLADNDRQSVEARAAYPFTARYSALIDAAIALAPLQYVPTESSELVEDPITLEAASTAPNTKAFLLVVLCQF